MSASLRAGSQAFVPAGTRGCGEAAGLLRGPAGLALAARAGCPVLVREASTPGEAALEQPRGTVRRRPAGGPATGRR
ncbi:hypothetical protein [Streptomyces sp. NK08204]|uniref:hypothetical protein n=1 Tax=Streptomyces sp. NK08204 TaxID=2873260 RepID=UPI001CEDC65D|nr:hypothetical protein [Streptomyces sp. NK08204]